MVPGHQSVCTTADRPAWEINCRLKIKALEPTVSMKGDFVIAFFRQLTIS